MLDAGFFMPKKAFFQNIGTLQFISFRSKLIEILYLNVGTILTYAVIGTMFNAFAIGLTIYGCYLLGLFPDIDDGPSKPLGVLGNGVRNK